MNILIINGPNLNMLGIREKEIYGKHTYAELEEYLNKTASIFAVEVEVFQSNSESDIVNKIHSAYFKKIDAIIINPAAFTHYSYSIYDALLAVNLRVVEVHLSDINNREEFRKINVIRDACDASFIGRGFESYRDAIEFLVGEKN